MKKFVVLILLLFFVGPAFNQEKQHKWQRFSGKWTVSDSKVTESNGWAIPWNYYEVADLNSIVTLKPLIGLTAIDVSAEINERVKTPSEFMISFAITSETESWFYHLYAFKVTGGLQGIDKASFIYSDRIDKTKPLNTQKNTFVKELASSDCKIKYDKMNKYRIAFEKSDVVLYINDEKVLSAPFPEKSHDGHIAISARNVKITVDKIEVFQKKKIIFEDDFNEDTIYVRTVKAKKVFVTDEEKSEEKKP